uniref:C2H2-type domain-containing protein n=1 Tax=Arion vulgaris TaxID=1028688 RepID=A0A0B7BR01_9EUPU
MENVLDTLGESSSLSPMSTNVHDEDFSGLGDHSEGVMEEDNLNSDGDDGLDHATVDDEDDDHVNMVSSSMTVDDDDPIGLGVTREHHSEDLHHVDDLEVVEVDETEHSENLEEDHAHQSLDEHSVLTSEGHLVQTTEHEGILLTTDADGNLAVPVSADHVIRLLMQTSDGNMVTANAQVEAIKFSMSSLMSSVENGEISQAVQAVTLPDGTTTLFETTKEELSSDHRVLPKFIEGQTIKLEDGTTALLQATPKEALNEGLHAIQLEDGSTAFISHNNHESLFSGASQLDTSSLNLDHLATQTMLGAADKSSEKTLLIGDKAFKCTYEDCGRLYTTHHHLKVHERSHTGDRPFQCEFPNCGKRFATGYGLKSHNRVHTGEKPYPCPHTEKGCEKAFKTSGDLQKHVRTHTGERPFKCPFEGCTQSFTTSNIRKVHIRTHTGERPYICTVEGCARAFASATNYKNHIRIHTGEKPYVCTVQGCGKRFTEYSSLYKHHVVHTHTKPYTCHCGKTYRQTSTLAMHKRTAHGEELPVGMLVTAQENGLSETDEPPNKKILIKTEITHDDGESSQNLVVDAGETSQMVLLTSGVGTTESATFVTSDGSHQVASLVTLQSPGNLTLQDLQHSGITGLTSLSLGENGQQVLVVTDPAHLEALQHLAVHHLETLSHTSDGLEHIQGTAHVVEGVEEGVLTESEEPH